MAAVLVGAVGGGVLRVISTLVRFSEMVRMRVSFGDAYIRKGKAVDYADKSRNFVMSVCTSLISSPHNHHFGSFQS